MTKQPIQHAMLWIRKYFFLSDPDPGGQLITDLAGSGTHLGIFVVIDKNVMSNRLVNY